MKVVVSKLYFLNFFSIKNALADYTLKSANDLCVQIQIYFPFLWSFPGKRRNQVVWSILNGTQTHVAPAEPPKAITQSRFASAK